MYVYNIVTRNTRHTYIHVEKISRSCRRLTLMFAKTSLSYIRMDVTAV